MTLPPANPSTLDDETLQRYFDGELPPSQSAAVEQHLAHSVEEQRRLASLERLRALLRQHAEEQRTASDGSKEATFAAVQQRLAKPPAGQRRTLGWLAGGMAAAAAIGWLALRRPPSASPVTLAENPRGSIVTTADFRDQPGIVFALQGDAGEPIAVVWIDER